MALVKCTECSKEISDQAAVCPSCGAPNKNRVKPMNGFLKALLVVGGLFILFLMFGAYEGSKPENREKQHDRDAIELCRSRISNPSLDPEAQRFVSRTCDYMVDQFRAKYGVEP